MPYNYDLTYRLKAWFQCADGARQDCAGGSNGGLPVRAAQDPRPIPGGCTTFHRAQLDQGVPQVASANELRRLRGRQQVPGGVNTVAATCAQI